MPAYLLDKGLTGRHGMVALALIAAANIVGTYYCGALGGLFRRKYLLSLLYLIRTAAIALFILLPLSPATLYAFAIVMGLLWLGTVPLTNGLLSQVFGVRYIGTLFGFVFLGHQIGAFLGVWLGGVVYDTCIPTTRSGLAPWRSVWWPRCCTGRSTIANSCVRRWRNPRECTVQNMDGLGAGSGRRRPDLCGVADPGRRVFLCDAGVLLRIGRRVSPICETISG